ncbi:Ltp family lipoprotein [Glutamicibacter uratoxydans]|uniref:Ltp family lipoprotein n=1 Tax=Glutamicibacter uratoxydans TaxID=43667 RepID=UPI003D6FEF18
MIKRVLWVLFSGFPGIFEGYGSTDVQSPERRPKLSGKGRRKGAEASARAEEEREKAEAGTVSQQNALRTAENYLSFTAFSREGLIDQLEFEQFSNADATWAVDRSKSTGMNRPPNPPKIT